MKCPVLRSLDLNMMMWPTIHNYYGAATAYAAPSPGVACEGSYHPMKWPPGMVTGDHKLASSVNTYFMSVVQAGHKLGPMVLHLEMIPAPDDLLTPVQMIMSSWEIKFQNGEVTAQGSPLGCLKPVIMNAMLCTDVVSMPFGFSPTSLISDVSHNVSWTDIIAGWVEIAVNAFFELIAFLAGGGFGSGMGGSGSATTAEIVSELTDALMPSPAGIIAGAEGTTLSSLAGAGVRWVGREYFGYGGAISVQTGASAGIFGGESLQYTSNPDGSWNVQHSETGPLGLTQTDSQYARDAQGQSSIQRTERVGSVTAQGTLSEQRQPDGSTRYTHQESISEGATGLSAQTQPRVVPNSMDWL